MYASAAECHVQLLERQVYSVANCPDQSFLSLCHRRNVVGQSLLYKENSNPNHCLFCELPSASTIARHTRASAAAHPLELEGTRCRTLKFSRCFLPTQFRMWNDLPYTVFDTRTLDEFKGAVNRWLIPWVVFSSVFPGAGACWVAKAIMLIIVSCLFYRPMSTLRLSVIWVVNPSQLLICSWAASVLAKWPTGILGLSTLPVDRFLRCSCVAKWPTGLLGLSTLPVDRFQRCSCTCSQMTDRAISMQIFSGKICCSWHWLFILNKLLLASKRITSENNYQETFQLDKNNIVGFSKLERHITNCTSFLNKLSKLHNYLANYCRHRRLLRLLSA